MHEQAVLFNLSIFNLEAGYLAAPFYLKSKVDTYLFYQIIYYLFIFIYGWILGFIRSKYKLIIS